MWCYFVIAFFDWTNGVFQQTVVKVYCMLNNPAGPSGLLQVCSFIKKKPQHKRFPVKYAKNTVFIKRLRWLLLKIHWKSNLWQFGLQYCRLWDFKLNENVLHQRGLDRTFKENILAKVNSLKLLKKKLPHWFFSQTLICLPELTMLCFCLSHLLTTIFLLKFPLIPLRYSMCLKIEFKLVVGLMYRGRP